MAGAARCGWPRRCCAGRWPAASGASGAVPHPRRSVRPAAGDDAATRGSSAPTYLREHVLASAGLLPMPEKTPLAPVVFGEIAHEDYRVAKVYFESLPGFFVTGNLYRPTGDGPFPAILSPHGHWTYGRLENTEIASVPGRAINLARQGFVVFTYDAIGYNDSRQLPHTFDGRRERLWGLSLGRAAALEQHPRARLPRDAAVRAARRDRRDRRVRRRHADVPAGGGRRARAGRRAGQHDLAADAGRLPVREPARPAPRHHQRRDRRDDRAAAAADGVGDRRLDHATRCESEYPAVRQIYALDGAESTRARRPVRRAAQLQPRQSRGGLRLDGALAAERAGRRQAAGAIVHAPIRCPTCWCSISVRCPPMRVTAAQLTDNWIAAAKRQLAAGSPADVPVRAPPRARASAPQRRRAARPPQRGAAHGAPRWRRRRRSSGSCAQAGLTRAPIAVHAVRRRRRRRRSSTSKPTTARLPPSASPTSSRPRANHPARCWSPTATTALAGLLAAARRADLAGDPRRRRTSTRPATSMFLDRLYIPGLRRAGDLTDRGVDGDWHGRRSTTPAARFALSGRDGGAAGAERGGDRRDESVGAQQDRGAQVNGLNWRYITLRPDRPAGRRPAGRVSVLVETAHDVRQHRRDRGRLRVVDRADPARVCRDRSPGRRSASTRATCAFLCRALSRGSRCTRSSPWAR